jgi:hypothetical protein
MDQPHAELYAQIRHGRVQSVDAKRHTARVEFFEIDGAVSWDLQVLVTRPGDYSLPAVGTPVLCAILDGSSGVGYVLGAIYTESDEAPLDDEGARSLAGDDVRLGDPEAEKPVGLDGDKSDGGTLVFVPGTGGATLTYFKPGVPPVGTGTVIQLEAKLEASAENVRAK